MFVFARSYFELVQKLGKIVSCLIFIGRYLRRGPKASKTLISFDKHNIESCYKFCLIIRRAVSFIK